MAGATVPLLILALLVCAGIAAQHFPISLGSGHKVTLGGTVYFAEVLLLGPLLAVPVVAASDLLGQGLLVLRRDPQTRITAGAWRGPPSTRPARAGDRRRGTVYALSVGLAGGRRRGRPGLPPRRLPAGPGPRAAHRPRAAGTMFLVNSLALSAMVALAGGSAYGRSGAPGSTGA